MSNPMLNVFPTPELPLPDQKAKSSTGFPKERIGFSGAAPVDKSAFSTKYIFGWIIIASLIFVAVGAWANSLRIVVSNFVDNSLNGLIKGKVTKNKKKNPDQDAGSGELSSELPIAIIFTIGVVIAIYVIRPSR